MNRAINEQDRPTPWKVVAMTDGHRTKRGHKRIENTLKITVATN